MVCSYSPQQILDFRAFLLLSHFLAYNKRLEIFHLAHTLLSCSDIPFKTGILVSVYAIVNKIYSFVQFKCFSI